MRHGTPTGFGALVWACEALLQSLGVRAHNSFPIEPCDGHRLGHWHDGCLTGYGTDNENLDEASETCGRPLYRFGRLLGTVKETISAVGDMRGSLRKQPDHAWQPVRLWEPYLPLKPFCIYRWTAKLSANCKNRIM